METLQEAPRGAEGASRGRQQMDRHRRHLALRRLRLQPEGIRIGQEQGRHRRAVKVWDKREYRNSTTPWSWARATSRSRCGGCARFAREGAAEELDLDDTIARPPRNAGWLDIKMVPERHNSGEGAAVAGRRRLDGRAHHARARSCFPPRADRVQAPGVLLLPQLRLRLHVEGQPAPLRRDASDLGRACASTTRTTS